jgi:hypothetical protein
VKHLFLPVALLLLAACAAGSRRARPPHEDVLVTVENDLVVRSEVTLRLVSSTGARTLLGVVPAGRRTEFRYAESSFAGTYRLVAQPGIGEDFSSPAFALHPGARIHWALTVNVVTVQHEEASRSGGGMARALANE